jgi:hypothetical protein
MSTFNAFMLAGAIAAIVVCYFAFVDHWNHIKKVVGWFRKQATHIKPDPTPVALDIPPAPPPTELPADGVNKKVVMYIMFGPNRLLAYELPRPGGTRFVVERHLPNQQPIYCDTAD